MGVVSIVGRNGSIIIGGGSDERRRGDSDGIGDGSVVDSFDEEDGVVVSSQLINPIKKGRMERDEKNLILKR